MVVAETVAKAFEFYRRVISNSMNGQKIPVLRRLCADNSRNWEEGDEGVCKHCGREGQMQSQEVPTDQLVDASAFVAASVSLGTIVNFHLSTSCSRLQKQAQSLASLSCDSFMDMIHQDIKKISNGVISYGPLEETAAPEDSDDDVETMMVTDVGSDYEDDGMDCIAEKTSQPQPQPPSQPTPKMPRMSDNMKEAMELVALYNSSKFEAGFSRVQLDCAALHAQALKYDNETKFASYKEEIQYTYNNGECFCADKISNFLSEIEL